MLSERGDRRVLVRFVLAHARPDPFLGEQLEGEADLVPVHRLDGSLAAELAIEDYADGFGGCRRDVRFGDVEDAVGPLCEEVDGVRRKGEVTVSW